MDNSGVWRGQIDYLVEEWKRFVELREELIEWIRKAEAYLERDENVYGFTVSELEEQIDKHKVKSNWEAYAPEGRGDGRLCNPILALSVLCTDFRTRDKTVLDRRFTTNS